MENHQVVLYPLPFVVEWPSGSSQSITKHNFKARIEGTKGTWASKLSEILWRYQTTCRNSTDETPLVLAFGSEEVIPTKVNFPTYRTSQPISEESGEAQEIELYLLKENRIDSNIHNAIYNQISKKYYNLKVRVRQFWKSDLVLKKVKGVSKGPFDPTWGGPFR